MKINFTPTLLALLLCIGAQAAHADTILFPATDSSKPSDTNKGVLVEQGRKSILLKMQCTDSKTGDPLPDCWPLQSGTPSITFGGKSISCPIGPSPAVNNCSSTIVPFVTGDPEDTFEILYNSDFPQNTQVMVTVADAKGSNGLNEDTRCSTNPPEQDCIVTFITGNDIPRANTDLELVFDVSGSMSLPATDTDTTNSRIQRLQVAADAMLASYKQNTILGDQLGAVTFSTTATSLTPGMPNFISGFDPAAVDNVQTMIDALVPTDSTAIGLGLTTAKNMGFDADASGNAKWVILFSDGEQNIPAPSGDLAATSNGNTGQVTVAGQTYSTGTNKIADHGQISICPVTAGLQTSNGFVLQQAIANAVCNGQNAYVGMSQDFVSYFQQFITTILKGDKFEISRDLTSTVNETPSVTFLGNSRDLSFTINLTYAPVSILLSPAKLGTRASITDAYTLIAPDGRVVPVTPVLFGTGSVAKINLPVFMDKPLNTRGQWKVVFNPAAFATPDFHLVVINDNPTINTTFTSLGNDIGTGEPLAVEATVLDGQRPLTNAVVTVDVSGPNFGLGNVLSTTTATASLPEIGGDDPGSAGAQKLLMLANDPANAQLFGVKSLPSQTLRFCRPEKDDDDYDHRYGHDYDRDRDPRYDQDRDGDHDNDYDRDHDHDHRYDHDRDHDHHGRPEACPRPHHSKSSALAASAAAASPANDVYQTIFTNSALEGHYFFTFHVSGNSAGNGPFERTWKLSVFVRPKAFGPNTPILVESVSQGSDGIMAQLRVAPHDRLNNFVGPGYDGALEIVSGEQHFPFTTDNLDGSYEIANILTVPGNSKVTLRVLGTDVKTIDLAKVQPGQTL